MIFKQLNLGDPNYIVEFSEPIEIEDNIINRVDPTSAAVYCISLEVNRLNQKIEELQRKIEELKAL